MKGRTVLSCLCVCVLLAGLNAFGIQQSAKRVEADELERLLAKIAQYDYGGSREGLVDLAEYFSLHLGDRKQVSALEKRLIQFLDSDATVASKDFICRHLAVIASETSVPVLSKMIQKPATFEMSRCVLEKIPGEKADKILREVLVKTSDEHRIGVINTIGVRRDRKAVRLLIPLLDDPETVEAAAAALARIGDREGIDALFSAKTTGDEVVRSKVQEALMDVADECLASGKNQAAFLIYRNMAFISERDPIRIAGLNGLSKAAGVGAIPLLLSALTDGEAPVQAAAIKLLVRFQSPSVTKELIKAYSGLPELTKVRLLTAFGEANERASTSFVMGEAKKEGSDPVRAAALQALARLGDASSVALLSATAAESKGPVQEAARSSLYRIQGAEVDQAILAAIPAAALPVKIELVRAIAERGITAASPVLTQALGESQPEVRNAAIKALVEVGTAADVPALLAFLTSTDVGVEREQAGRALAFACRRSGGKGLDQVLARYETATGSLVKETLVGVIGNIGNKEGLPLLRAALKDSDGAVRRAAILALGEWLDAEPVADLLAAAREASLPTHHVLALRGYLKLVALPSDRPGPESVGLVARAIETARDPEMKKAALAVLPRFVCQEAVDLAAAAAADPAVKAEAEQAVKRLKESLGYR